MAKAKITVVGAGLMGHGIAQVFALAGHDVAITDAVTSNLGTVKARVAANLRDLGDDERAVERISPIPRLDEAVRQADYVVEAVLEDLPLKQKLFADIEAAAPPTAILASNTSVIPITKIMQGLKNRERALGTHWWNPPYLVPLVEVVQAARTSDATVAATMDLLRAVGKAPAHVKKDLPGFVANRLQHALWREAIAMVADGVCDAATLDDCVKHSFGLRLPVLGPLENADLVGLDLTLDIHRTMIPELDRHDRPHAYLEAKVAAGELGFKSGKGFQRWTPAAMADVRVRLAAHLVKAQAERT